MRKLTQRDLELLHDFDPAYEIEQWSAIASNNNLKWDTKFTWNDDRATMAIHPSSLYNPCDMVLYLELLGGGSISKNSPHSQLIFDVGTAVHEMFAYYQGTRAAHNGYTYKSEVGFNWNEGATHLPDLRMAGHCDGISIGWPIKTECLWEYKTINERGFNRLKSPSKAHLIQIHAYMANLNIPVAIILYINKNTSAMAGFKVPFSKTFWKPHEERVHKIVERAKLVEDPQRTVGSACWQCKFLEECNPPRLQKRKSHPQGALVI